MNIAFFQFPSSSTQDEVLRGDHYSAGDIFSTMYWQWACEGGGDRLLKGSPWTLQSILSCHISWKRKW